MIVDKKYKQQSYDFIKGQLDDLNDFNLESSESFKSWVNSFDDINIIGSIAMGISTFKHDISLSNLLKFDDDKAFKKEISEIYFNYVMDRFNLL